MHPLWDLSFQVTGELCLLYQEQRIKDILSQIQYCPSLCHVLTHSSSFMFNIFIHTHTHSLSVFSVSSSWAMFVIVCFEIPRCLPVPVPLWCSGSENSASTSPAWLRCWKGYPLFFFFSLSFLWCRWAEQCWYLMLAPLMTHTVAHKFSCAAAKLVRNIWKIIGGLQSFQRLLKPKLYPWV